MSAQRQVLFHSGACSSPRALLLCSVFQVLRIALAISVLPLAISAKEIRLRNELIRTPDKKENVAAAKAQSDEARAEGLFLIQFDGAVTDSQREGLLRLN